MTPTILLALARSCTGEAKSGAGSDRKLAKGWLRVCQVHPRECRIFPAKTPKAESKLLPRPVFYHSQPVRADQVGALFLWVQAAGRPAVIGDIFARTG